MREIKFRGKRIDNEEWAYGIPVKIKINSYDYCYALVSSIDYDELEGFSETINYKEVLKETMGQSVGQKDHLDKEYFEGDWVILDDYTIGILVYDEEMNCFGFNIHEGENINNYDDSCYEFEPLYYFDLQVLTIEGNIYDKGEYVI